MAPNFLLALLSLSLLFFKKAGSMAINICMDLLLCSCNTAQLDIGWNSPAPVWLHIPTHTSAGGSYNRRALSQF